MSSRERGHAIPVGEWWLRLVRQLLENDTRDLQQLGADLARHVRRRNAFDKGVLSRIKTNALDPKTKKPAASVTIELAEAICLEWRKIPPPFLRPRTYLEAVDLARIAEGYDDVPSDDNGPSATPALVVPLPATNRRKRDSAPPAAERATPATLPVRRRAR